MDSDMLQKRLTALCGRGSVLREEPMSAHTSFRIGGPAAFFVTPGSAEILADVIRMLRESEIPFFILGNGSNLLAADEGYRGVVVQIAKNLGSVHAEGECITAGAGALLAQIAREALTRGLTGMEFASGIPGTFGGACIMNAGAYGGEMKDILKEVVVLAEDGSVRPVSPEEMQLGYRSSGFARRGDIVLQGTISLHGGDPETIRERMEELAAARREKQPLTQPSAGSTFKRPEGQFAGKLISDAGLKGYRIGGAKVSEKHAGFIVNTGGATAQNVKDLIRYVQDRVEEMSGIRLEPEVKYLGISGPEAIR